MNVGVVIMNPSGKHPEALLNTLQTIFCKIDIIQCSEYTNNELETHIAESPIQKWIFTGSPVSIYTPSSPKVPMNIFNIPNKEFFLICYSMESTLHQLEYPVLKRKENRKEEFYLPFNREQYTQLFQGLPDPALCMRNHHYYTPMLVFETKNSQMQLISSYQNEAMIVLYKNCVMTQFHPEKTDHGRQLLFNWIYN